ncbi:MAG TPA: hypothetical protein VFV36_10480, partial [Candidatus Methylomirabilis sp.]|nr:hypothetical protein [Candidatus Methylomirabilis sp.]
MAETPVRRGESGSRAAFRVLLGAPRTAARPVLLLGVWGWWTALELVGLTLGSTLAALVFWPLFALAGLLLWGFVSRVAARDAAGVAGGGFGRRVRELVPPDW